MNDYNTKTTWLGTEYGCRIYRKGVLIMEKRCKTKNLIGPCYRSMFRIIDKGGGDKFTSAVRDRMFSHQEGRTFEPHKTQQEADNLDLIWYPVSGTAIDPAFYGDEG